MEGFAEGRRAGFERADGWKYNRDGFGDAGPIFADWSVFASEGC